MSNSRGAVRIIGGKWRSRKIEIPDIEGLRPTPDRVRETIFNWLSQAVMGANCLDLFSGTGVMAFEALSRGASKVTVVEQSKIVCAHLYTSAQKLQIPEAEFSIMRQDVVAWLKQIKTPQGFDLVFLDPPYHQDWLTKVLPMLFSCKGLLNPDCLIYIESEKNLGPELLPNGAEIQKYKQAGKVHYFLVRQKSS